MNRLKQQLDFIIEIDKVKQILRQTLLMDASRQENDAEHSWHLAMMALVLAEYANAPVDILKVIKMVLIHDLVEIDAGDTFLYGDARQQEEHRQRERQAAIRIFGLLPAEQGAELKALWEEFEAKESMEARFAGALDRLQPLLHNYQTQGAAWQQHGVKVEQVLKMNAVIASGSEELWEYALQLIESAVTKGYL